MANDIIKIKNSDKKENINKLTPESLQVGELALIIEPNYEKLYCKNANNEIVPLNRVMNGGKLTLPPTIQEAWIDTGLAQWSGDTAAMNQVRFNTGLTGDLIPPKVLDMSRLVFMRSTFTGCNDLTSLDLNNFDTSNVTDMSYMFSNCTGLTSLDVTSFDTSKVIDMSWMFNNCSDLTSLDVSSFDTSKVTNMQAMFRQNIKLTSLDLSNFDTFNVSNMDYMFQSCSELTSLDLSNFDTSKVDSALNMFRSCNSLTKITCKQSFKDWCIRNQDTIYLPNTMRENGGGTWIIFP